MTTFPSRQGTRVLAASLLLATAGCMAVDAPRVVGAHGDRVVVGWFPSEASLADAQELADGYCAKRGSHALVGATLGQDRMTRREFVCDAPQSTVNGVTFEAEGEHAAPRPS